MVHCLCIVPTWILVCLRWGCCSLFAFPNLEKYTCLWHGHLHRHCLHGGLPGKEMAGVMCCTLDTMLLSAGVSVLWWWSCPSQHILRFTAGNSILHYLHSMFSILSCGFFKCRSAIPTSLTPQQAPTLPDAAAAHSQAKPSWQDQARLRPGWEAGARQGTRVHLAELLLRPKAWQRQLSTPGHALDHPQAMYKMQKINLGNSKCWGSHVLSTDPVLSPKGTCQQQRGTNSNFSHHHLNILLKKEKMMFHTFMRLHTYMCVYIIPMRQL